MKKFYISILFLLLFLLFSCKNFLNGASLKEDLEKAIDYAKAPKASVVIKASGHGDVFPDKAVLIKGESVDIEFIINNESEFLEWVCRADTEYEMSELVKFSKEENTTMASGVKKYNVTVTLKEVIPEIEIQPRCIRQEKEKPEIVKFNIAQKEEDILNERNLNFDKDDVVLFADYAAGEAVRVKENIKKHHVSKKIWIDFEVKDSALKSAWISEKLTRTPENTIVSGTEAKITRPFETDLFENKNDAGKAIPKEVASYCFEYEFLESADGVIDLSFYVEDVWGNITEKTVNLIKDTLVNVETKYDIAVNDTRGKTVNEALSDPELSENGLIKKEYYFEFKAQNTPFVKDMNGKAYYDSDDWELVSIETWTDEKSEKVILDAQTSKSDRILKVGSETAPVVFKKDPYEDMYISINLTDGAGNIFEHTMNLYKCVDIVQVLYNETDKSFDLILNKKFADNASPIVVSALKDGEKNTVSSSFIRIDKVQGSINVNQLRTENGKQTLAQLTAGTYELYVQGAGKAYLSNPYYVTKTQSGTYSFSKTLTSSPAALTLNDLPSFTVIADEAKTNAAKRTVHVQYDGDFTERDELNYLVKYWHDDVIKWTAQKDFEVENHACDWNFKIYVYDERGNYVCTSDSNTKTLDLSYDNIPPQCDGYNFINYPDKVLIKNFTISDTGCGLKKENDKILVEYFFSNYDYYNGSMSLQINWDDPNLSKKSTFSDEASVITIYSDGSSLMNLYFRIFDNNLNYLDIKIKRALLESLENIETVYENETITMTLSGSIPNKTAVITLSENILGIKNSNSYTNIWAEYLTKDEKGNDYWKDVDSTSLNGTSSLFLTDAEINSFLRINLSSNTSITGYFYLYPKKYLDHLETELCDALAGIRGINIFSDMPYFVHTYYTNQPKENIQNNADYWVNNAIELKIQQKSSNYTYLLPESLWNEYKDTNYISIVHFADGTVIMTE